MKSPPNRRRPSVPPPLAGTAVPDDDPIAPPLEVAASDFSVRAPAMSSEPDAASPRWARARPVLSIATALAALGACIVGGHRLHHWLTHSPHFGARDIAVAGTRHTTESQILAAGGLQAGVNLLGLDIAGAERDIAALPWVEHARVTRRLPGTVRVEVTERTAVALVAAEGMYLATSDGLAFKRVESGDPDDLPVITGIDRTQFSRDPDAAAGAVRDALALLADVSASSVAGRETIDEVHRDATGDLSMVLARSGTYVWLGRGPYRAKMARLSVILGELDARHIEAAEIHLESDRNPERATVRVPIAPESPQLESPRAAVIPRQQPR